MDIKERFQAFSHRLVNVGQLLSAIRNSSRAQLNALAEQRKRSEGTQWADVPVSATNLFFYSAVNGEMATLGVKKLSIDEKITESILHHNRQYQWLLAEAYEAYEDYMEELYAWVGMHDKEAWPLSDFGNCRLPDLEAKGEDFYLAQAMRKKDKPRSILLALRKAFPDFERAEVDNPLEVNLRLCSLLIEKMRHATVHNRGVVVDRDKFVGDLLNESGVSGNEKRNGAKQFIESHFSVINDECIVLLLDVPIESPLPSPISTYHDVSGSLLKRLASHAHLATYHCLSVIQPTS